MCDLPEDPAFERRIWFDPEMSVLVRPLSVSWQLEPSQIAWLAYIALVAVYLAVPTLVRAARSAFGQYGRERERASGAQGAAVGESLRGVEVVP